MFGSRRLALKPTETRGGQTPPVLAHKSTRKPRGVVLRGRAKLTSRHGVSPSVDQRQQRVDRLAQAAVIVERWQSCGV